MLQARAYQIKPGHTMTCRQLAIAALPLVLTLAGCGAAVKPKEAPLAGAPIGGPFTLINQNGTAVSDAKFAGQYRIVYFGYTSCPDVCPTDLAKIGQSLRELEKSDPAVASKVTPIFISVDPERDTKDAIKEYVANFHPRMVGLTGSPDEIKKVADEYKIYYAKMPPDEHGFVRFDHTRIAYLMGPKGEPIAPISADMTPAMIEDLLKQWVK